MLLVIMADAGQTKELQAKGKNTNIKIEYINEYREIPVYQHADAFFILGGKLDIEQVQLIRQPVFIHSVISTLNDLNMPSNVSRINAWPTFLQRSVWEVATKDEAIVKDIFEQVGWKFLVTHDEPGFISARIIAMIINEAYFTLDQKISSKEEIDAAMKLGTNYPCGPFEWAQKIGLENIHTLIKTLHRNNGRYEVCPAIEKELMLC
jgi:3-hydroxybutyryl-CoA dehydrogenase